MTLLESVELFESIKDLLLKDVPEKYHYSMMTTFIRRYFNENDIISPEEHKNRLVSVFSKASVEERVCSYYHDPYLNMMANLSAELKYEKIQYKKAKKLWDASVFMYERVDELCKMRALSKLLRLFQSLEDYSPFFALTRIRTRNKIIKVLKENGYNTQKVESVTWQLRKRVKNID